MPNVLGYGRGVASRDRVSISHEAHGNSTLDRSCVGHSPRLRPLAKQISWVNVPGPYV